MPSEIKRSLKILVLDEEIPFPPDSGKRIRTWSLLKRLAKNHTIHLLCYGRPEDASCVAIRSEGVVLHLVEAPRTLTGFGLYIRLLANLFSRYPYSVVKHYSPQFQRALNDLLRREHWDLVQCEWTPYARFLSKVEVQTLIASHNVESQIWRRRAENSEGFIKRVFFHLQEWKMAWFERRCLRQAGAVTAVSEADAKMMKTWGVERVAVVPNGVDPEFYNSATGGENENEILSIASLDWFPNADSVDYFTQQILPLIHARRPDAVFRVVGRRPPEWLKEKLSALPGVDFVGEVDDVRPHLERAAVVVVPLRIGGGSRLKILEALAARKAVVSTSVGAEGLELESGQHLLIADSPQEFAERLTKLLESPLERRELGEKGRKLITQRFGWDGIARGLETVWLKTAQPRVDSSLNRPRIMHLRASNFVGGPEKQILHHALDIRDLGFDVWIGSFRDESTQPEMLRSALESGLPIFEARRAVRFDPRGIFEVAAFLKREKIQVLCTHGFKANVIGALAKKIAGVPQIAFCRGWTAETPSVRFYEFLERCLLALADQIICVSEAQAEYFASNHFLQPRVKVVHNAMLDSVDTAVECDRGASKMELGFSPKTRLVGAVGRLSIEKGQRYLVEAAPALLREFKDLKIVLLGEGRERSHLEALIVRLGLSDVVVLPGFHKNVARWMQAFDVVANCSLTEGIPNAILEALAVGTPVVATAVGGVPQLIKDRETGLLVTPGDANALCRGVAEVLRDPQLACELGQTGRAWVRTRFSASGQRDALLAIYQESLGKCAAMPKRSTEPSISLAPLNTPPNPGRSVEVESVPFITIVIPVRNEEAHLKAVLQSLLDQEYPRDRYEILVADGNSVDGTARIVEQLANSSATCIKLLPNPLQLSSAGRNVGVRQSAGELIFFVDGHCHIPSKTLLRDAVTLFEKTGADCLCRPQPLYVRESSFFQKGVAQARATALGHGRDSAIFDLTYEGPINPSSAGALYRRTVFDCVGLYDESFDAAEDVEFNHRVFKSGLGSYISPRMAIEYQTRENFPALWRQMVRYGKGRCRLIKKHHDAFSFSQIMPAMLLLWLLLGAPASLLSRPFFMSFGLSLAIYAATLLFFSIRIAWRHGLALLAITPAIFLAIHLGLGAGFLAEALKWRVGKSQPEKTGPAIGSGNAKPLEPPYSIQA
jgi:glycosyltransferase involved in cell wall biosynthesis